MKRTLILPDESKTIQFGTVLANYLLSQTIIYLQGDIGVGKTTMVRALLRALGVEGTIKSPTFSLVEPYEINKGAIYHFDFYRLKAPEELDYLAWRDYFSECYLVFVEWPEMVYGKLPIANLQITFSRYEQGRMIEIIALDMQGKQILEKLMLDEKINA